MSKKAGAQELEHKRQRKRLKMSIRIFLSDTQVGCTLARTHARTHSHTVSLYKYINICMHSCIRVHTRRALTSLPGRWR